METLAVAVSEPTSEAKAFSLPLTEAQRQWARCRPYIERAMARGPGLETITDVESNIEQGQAIFWAGPDCGLVTRLDTFPAGKVLVLVYADGDGDRDEMAKRSLPQLEDFCRFVGANFLAVESDGKDRELLESHGFRHAFTAMIKPVHPPGSEAAETETQGDQREAAAA